MTIPKRVAATAAGLIAALATVSITPPLSAQNAGKSVTDTLVVEDARVDWIERSNVAALREGVIDRMELEIGTPVEKDKPIGYLRATMAELNVRKAEVAAHSVGPKAKAKAQEELAVSVLAINKRLNDKMKGAVSYEEQKKAEAELKVASAMYQEAEEKVKLDEAELALARQALDEHTIRAPISGIIIERMKHPGESIRANEPVVRIGNLDRLRAWGYAPLEYAYRVKVGQIVDLQPRLSSDSQNVLPIEQKRFRGKITFVDPQIQAEGERAVRFHAEFENKDGELRPGLKAVLTIHIGDEGAPAVGARTGRSGLGR